MDSNLLIYEATKWFVRKLVLWKWLSGRASRRTSQGVFCDSDRSDCRRFIRFRFPISLLLHWTTEITESRYRFESVLLHQRSVYIQSIGPFLGLHKVNEIAICLHSEQSFYSLFLCPFDAVLFDDRNWLQIDVQQRWWSLSWCSASEQVQNGKLLFFERRHSSHCSVASPWTPWGHGTEWRGLCVLQSINLNLTESTIWFMMSPIHWCPRCNVAA